MTKKHFNDLADVVGEIQAIISTDEHLSTNGLMNMMQWKIMEFCKRQNKKFDGCRFSMHVGIKRNEMIGELDNLKTNWDR